MGLRVIPPPKIDVTKFWFAYYDDGNIMQYGQGNAPHNQLKGAHKTIEHNITTYQKHETTYKKELEIIALFSK